MFTRDELSLYSTLLINSQLQPEEVEYKGCRASGRRRLAENLLTLQHRRELLPQFII